jgi:hypothetical protein
LNNIKSKWAAERSEERAGISAPTSFYAALGIPASVSIDRGQLSEWESLG